MIDKSDNNEISNPVTPDNTTPAKKPRGAGFALFIAFLALFFTAAGIAAGYKHWQRMSDRAKSNASQIAALEKVIATKSDSEVFEALRKELRDSQAAQQKTVSNYLMQMQQMHSQTEQFSNTVTSQVKQITAMQSQLQNATAPKTSEDWRFAEADFLLKLASRELQLSGNREAATSALREADQILSENGSVSYLPVRRQIANDLAALAAMKVPDILLLSQHITVLSRKLEPVPDEAADTDADTNAGADNESAPAQNNDKTATSPWINYKNKAVSILNDAVIIRQLDKPLAKELSVEAREQAYQLLLLRLEALRLMALQQQDKAYHQQLELIRDNVNTYYPPQQARAIQTTLDQLAAVNLLPPIPDISGSQQQLQKARIAEVGQ